MHELRGVSGGGRLATDTLRDPSWRPCMRKTKYAVYLTEAERAHLRTLIGCGEASARMLTHARILLKANQGEGGPGWSDAAIAGALEVAPSTVFRVRQQYVTEGLSAALERKASDRVYEGKLDGVQEAK